jgi:hypothetical protein
MLKNFSKHFCFKPKSLTSFVHVKNITSYPTGPSPPPLANPKDRAEYLELINKKVDEPEVANENEDQDNNGPTYASNPDEVNGPKGPEPTRYGDWEKGGRVYDF